MKDGGFGLVPNLNSRFFWDLRIDSIDWQRDSAFVIERIIERGSQTEWRELVRFYGRKKVVDTIVHDVNYLPEEIIDEVCSFFELKPIDLKCFTKRPSIPKHWI